MKTAIFLAAILALATAAPLPFYDTAGYFDLEVPLETKTTYWQGMFTVTADDLSAGANGVELHMDFTTDAVLNTRKVLAWITSSDVAPTGNATYTFEHSSVDYDEKNFLIFFDDVPGFECTTENMTACTIYIALQSDCKNCRNSLSVYELWTRLVSDTVETTTPHYLSQVEAGEEHPLLHIHISSAEFEITKDAYHYFIYDVAPSAGETHPLFIISETLSRTVALGKLGSEPQTNVTHDWTQTKATEVHSLGHGLWYIGVYGDTVIPLQKTVAYRLCLGAGCSGAATATLSLALALFAAFLALF
jgi:hypothetical protein